MALLKMNYELPSSLVATNAYIRIDTISGNAINLNLDVKVYASELAAKDGLPYIDAKQYQFEPDVSDESANYHKQGYEYLKTLDDYKNAIDA